MDHTQKHQIRCRTYALILSAGCLTQAACSSNKGNDWFRFGKDSQSEAHHEQAQQPDSLQESEPSDSENSGTDQSQTIQPIIAAEPDEPGSSIVEAQDPNSIQTTPQPVVDVEEVVQLYRRLHVEMDQANRSQLIVELLGDQREPVKLLGFELASRDLSAGATLSADAANAAISLLNDPHPSIRTGAARLINRLALPDAMTLLTEALNHEQDSEVAIALLRGIERWPNENARQSVLRWYSPESPARAAAANAAWQIADLGLWDTEQHAQSIRSTYRSISNNELTQSEMRLIAVTGDSSDIDRLITLLRDDDNPSQSDAANALAYTPLGADPLIDLAMDDPEFALQASKAIDRHRLNPNGIRQMASLNWSTEQARTDALVQACEKLDHNELTNAVRLARTDKTINDALSIRLLSRLIAGAQTVSPRSAPGVALLAQLELQNLRPDRAIEAVTLLPESGLDPDTALRANTTAAASHILLGEYDQADLLTQSPIIWFDTLSLSNDQNTQAKIAAAIQARSFDLSDEQQQILNTLIVVDSPTPEESP
jgi:HEAT repeats